MWKLSDDGRFFLKIDEKSGEQLEFDMQEMIDYTNALERISTGFFETVQKAQDELCFVLGLNPRSATFKDITIVVLNYVEQEQNVFAGIDKNKIKANEIDLKNESEV